MSVSAPRFLEVARFMLTQIPPVLLVINIGRIVSCKIRNRKLWWDDYLSFIASALLWTTISLNIYRSEEIVKEPWYHRNQVNFAIANPLHGTCRMSIVTFLITQNRSDRRFASYAYAFLGAQTTLVILFSVPLIMPLPSFAPDVQTVWRLNIQRWAQITNTSGVLCVAAFLLWQRRALKASQGWFAIVMTTGVAIMIALSASRLYLYLATEAMFTVVGGTTTWLLSVLEAFLGILVCCVPALSSLYRIRPVETEERVRSTPQDRRNDPASIDAYREVIEKHELDTHSQFFELPVANGNRESAENPILFELDSTQLLELPDAKDSSHPFSSHRRILQTAEPVKNVITSSEIALSNYYS